MTSDAIETRFGEPCGRWKMLEFRCPKHGVFEALVKAPNEPDEMPCPHEMIEEYFPGDPPALCGEMSPWTISAPKPKVDSIPCFATVSGGDMKDRPPGMLDTRPLAEGQSLKEWRKVQDGHRQERNHQRLVKQGLKQKRIQVG